MTTHLTKIWWDLHKDELVKQEIPEAEIYKREWVGLTEEEIAVICGECAASAHRADDISYARAIEAKLREKNSMGVLK